MRSSFLSQRLPCRKPLIMIRISTSLTSLIRRSLAKISSPRPKLPHTTINNSNPRLNKKAGIIATAILAILGVCRFWGLLSQVVEEEFALFLGMSKNASYLCLRKREQAAPQQLRVNSIAFGLHCPCHQNQETKRCFRISLFSY